MIRVLIADDHAVVREGLKTILHETDDIRRLSGLTVSDLEWAPDATELFIASAGGVVVYSVATDEIRPLGGTSGVRSFTLSHPSGCPLNWQWSRSPAATCRRCRSCRSHARSG